MSVACEKFRTAVLSINERQTDEQISKSSGFKSSSFLLQRSTGQSALLQAPAITLLLEKEEGPHHWGSTYTPPTLSMFQVPAQVPQLHS